MRVLAIDTALEACSVALLDGDTVAAQETQAMARGHAEALMPMLARLQENAAFYFAVIDLVASVGLWLAAPWGAVVWLTASVSMTVIQVFFPGIYGAQAVSIAVECILVIAYLVFSVLAAREHGA